MTDQMMTPANTGDGAGKTDAAKGWQAERPSALVTSLAKRRRKCKPWPARPRIR